MQADTIQGQNEQVILRDVLHIIASTPDTEGCVRQILPLIQTAAGAAGARFVLLAQPVLALDAGLAAQWYAGVEELASALAALGEGVHPVSGPLAASLPPMCSGLLAPLRYDDALAGGVCLLFDRPTPDVVMSPLLLALIDSLAILATRARLQEDHEDAHHLTTSLLSSIIEPLIVLDDSLRVLLMNAAAEALFNLSSAQASGQPLRDVVRSDALMALVEQNEAAAEWTTEDDKTFVPRIQPIKEEDERVVGWVLALQDVTRFKKLNRNQSEFMHIVSHDLRSPLTSMQGFASMLELGLVGEMNEKQAQFVEKILAGITQITALVDNIQDAGRFDPETGFYEMTRSQCDLGDIVNRIVKNHLLPAEKQELTVNVHVADDVPIINADGNMLERAITNLVDNAIKYTPNGGRIDVGVDVENSSVVVSVRDTGLGISPENQKHLFQRHVRIARQEHKKIKGSGLGLFIVRSVAQRHGGDAHVESVEGKGSTFFLTIPLSGANLVVS